MSWPVHVVIDLVLVVSGFIAYWRLHRLYLQTLTDLGAARAEVRELELSVQSLDGVTVGGPLRCPECGHVGEIQVTLDRLPETVQ